MWGNSGESTCAADVSDSVITQVPTVKQSNACGQGNFKMGDLLFSLSCPLCSDWSRSVTVCGRHKKNNLVNSDSVASDNTFTIRKVSDSSTGSAPNHHQGAWAGLRMCHSVQLSLSRSIAQSQTKQKIDHFHACYGQGKIKWSTFSGRYNGAAVTPAPRIKISFEN